MADDLPRGDDGAGAYPPPERDLDAMFDRVAPRYDVLNAVLSLGFDRTWRRRTARAVAAPSGARALDLGCGTGALAEQLAGRFRVVAIDRSDGMLREARRRLPRQVTLVRASGLELPFADGSFGAAASAFVLRNLADIAAAFRELARVLAPGGGLALVDIVPPRPRLMRRAFDAYFARAAPMLGSLTRQQEAYRYLVRSLARLPPPDGVSALLAETGFARPAHRPLFPGPVTLWTATRA